MKNIPKWLDSALQGSAMICEGGSTAYVRFMEDSLTTEPTLIGLVQESDGKYRTHNWDITGHSLANCCEPSNYNIVDVKPLTFNHWKYLIPSIIAIAKDSDGKWWGYTSIPTKRTNGHWVGSSTPYHGLSALNLEFPECNWQDSLIFRHPDQKGKPADN